MSSKKAIYGFSGDPITFGHLDIIQRALAIFGELTVGIGVNPAKKYFFNQAQRKEIAEASLRFLPQVRVVAFQGLLVDYAYENNIGTVIRGIRNSEDLNYELMLHQIGESQKNDIDTIYFPAKQSLSHVSSGAVKALQLEQGLIHEYLPLYAKQQLEAKLSGQFILTITGEIGVGKSYVSQQFERLATQQNIPVHRIDIDHIGHALLSELTEPRYQSLRDEIAQHFGEDLKQANGFIDRKALGKIIFHAPEKLNYFNEIIYQPLLLQLRRALYGRRGLILLDTALVAEVKMSYLSNNNVLLVSATAEAQEKRLLQRGYSVTQIKARLQSQFTTPRKRALIQAKITADAHGKLWELENTAIDNNLAIPAIFEKIVQQLKITPTKI
ncbi:MAG: pantetheine-phosphate adenylyltransferase [Saprospiraceae bacterium]